MNPAIRVVRILQIGIIASVVAFFFISSKLPIPTQNVNASLQWAIVFCAIASALVGFIGQRSFLRVPNQAPSAMQWSSARGRWFAGHVLRFATGESVALFGLVLRSLYGPSNVVTALFAGSLLLLVFWQPGEVPTETESQGPIR